LVYGLHTETILLVHLSIYSGLFLRMPSIRTPGESSIRIKGTLVRKRTFLLWYTRVIKKNRRIKSKIICF
jgi:hypothetical protein